MCKIIGIDISKQTFDVCFHSKERMAHHVFINNLSGFEDLRQHLPKSAHVVMEASGPYYVQLATYLYRHGITVSVINPLKIKRYCQMQFYRAKTDKKDAQSIMEYGFFHKEELPLWKPEPTTIQQLKQLRSALELLQKQLGQSKRQLEAMQTTGYIDHTVAQTLEVIISTLVASIEKIEMEMVRICKASYHNTLKALSSIPGIGTKTAIMLIAITDDFTKFSHYKQLIAYVGLSPRIYQSGTSVKGKGHICKMGKAQLRKLLYMCSWSAKRCNKTCKDMYDRLKKKGKPERVIKIAIANKLLKQAFAIASSKTMYIENYQSNICF